MKLASLLWILTGFPPFGGLVVSAELGQSAKEDEKRERAPDGYRGFGETTLSRAAEVVVAKSKEDQAFLQHLRGLERDLELFLALRAEALRQEGVFKLAGLKPKRAKRDAPKPGVRELLQKFQERREEALENAVFDDFMAHMQANTRLRLLDEVLVLSEWDAREIDHGLAFLLTHREGWGDVTQEEARVVAARIDRAAARSRARNADLELLFHEDDSEAWTEREKAIEEALLHASKVEDDEARRKAVDEVLLRSERQADALRGLLASPRMREQLFDAQALTEARVLEAAESLPGLRELLPGTEEAQAAPKLVQDMSAQDRYGRLSFLSRANLGLDPLNVELNWLAGVSIDFLNGERNALRYFDRYLALRGIRSGRGKTHLKRKLTPEEQRALNEVQQAELQLPR